MAKITTHITLDVSKRSRLQAIAAKQYDRNSRYINVRLTNQGDFINIPLGSLVTINAERPDFQSKSFAGEVNADGTVTVRITYWMLELEGIVSCDISVEDAQSEKLSSLNFTIEVEHANYSGTEISDDDPQYDVFIQVLAGEADRVAAENERKANETERKTSEAARAQAEMTRQTNESTRQDNEAVRITNENARIAEEQNRAQAENARAQEFSTWEKQIDTIDSRSIRNSKCITNLEQGLPDDENYTDATVAYTKDVPSNALPYAEVKKIGGMTRKCANLCSLAEVREGYYDVSNNGVFVEDIGGHWKASAKMPCSPSTYYTLSNISLTSGYWVFFDNNDNMIKYSSLSASYLTIQTPANCTKISFYANMSGNIMLNEGSTALPFEPYYEGLRSAKAERVESVGVNLFDPQKIIDAGGTENNGEYTVGTSDFYQVWNKKDLSSVPCKKGTRYIIGFEGRNDNPADRKVTLIFMIVYTDGSQSAMAMVGGNEWNYQYAISTAGKDVSRISVNYSYSGMSYLRNVFIAKYTGDNSYRPYTKNSLPVPEAVQALDGYGWGVNADCYNYVDWKKQFVERVGKVDLGTLNWEYLADTFGGVFRTILTTMKQNTAASVCSKYQVVESNITNLDKAIYVKNNGNAVHLKDSTYTDAATFKAAMSGVMLYYELTEPIITDISDLLPEDNFIEVEGNGSITAVNEYGYDVPSEIEYQLEV